MDVWRLCRRPYADLSGDGARIFGGRWNSPGRPVVYFSEHPALAALEVRVHLDLPFELLPDDFVLMQVSLPNRLISGLGETVLAERTVAAGDAWVAERRSAALRVPSVLIPNAWNILLNPHHPNAGQVRIVGLEPFDFDPRLWQPLGGEG
ncbi:MAG: RES family NAD+ phosphorylase [Acetobacteraceae bacterium]|jgi:RES domain-containing protein